MSLLIRHMGGYVCWTRLDQRAPDVVYWGHGLDSGMQPLYCLFCGCKIDPWYLPYCERLWREISYHTVLQHSVGWPGGWHHWYLSQGGVQLPLLERCLVTLVVEIRLAFLICLGEGLGSCCRELSRSHFGTTTGWPQKFFILLHFFDWSEKSCHLFIAESMSVFFLAKYLAMTWLSVILKRRDAILSQLSKDISSDDKAKFRNSTVLRATALFSTDLVCQVVESTHLAIKPLNPMVYMYVTRRLILQPYGTYVCNIGP